MTVSEVMAPVRQKVATGLTLTTAEQLGLVVDEGIGRWLEIVRLPLDHGDVKQMRLIADTVQMAWKALSGAAKGERDDKVLTELLAIIAAEQAASACGS